MEKRLTMILACLFLSLGMALAQTAVTGTVVSQEDGQPIIGATVRVVGASAGAVTDADGKFSISMPAGHNKLKVTYVGMVDQDVTVKGNSVRVVLAPDETNLDEVMVVAYGTAKKSAFTGSAAVVKSEDIAKSSVANPVDALTGKVSGVQINSSTGQPGQESFSIRIRGVSSINAGNDPLIILDGAPYDGDLNSISNQDIASMTVLKDAASAALYGARGANGVVIITTKSGREGTSSITVDAKWGANTRGVEFYNTVESPAGYYEAYYQSLKNYRTSLGDDAATAHRWALNNMFSGGYDLGYNVYTVPEGQDFIGPNGKLNPNATLGRVVNVNGTEYLLYPDSWRDAAYQTGVRQEYNVTATGSNDKGSFYGSAGYLKNEGISIGSDYERFTGRLKADYQLRSWLKLSGNFNYAHYKANSLADDGGSTVGNVFMVKNMAPIYPLYIRDAAGNILQDSKTGLAMYDWGDGSVTGLTRPTMTGSNPIFANYFDKNQNEGNSLDATGTAEIRFLEDFKFTSANTVMLDETRFTYTNNPYYGQFAANNGSVQKAHVRTWAYNYQQLLNWHHLFDKHDVEVMLGHEYYRTRYYYLTASKNNVFSVFNDELAGAVNTGSMNSYTTDYNVEGWFGRVQYNYDNKYFGSLSYRRDASSRFHPDHRWGNFWSLGGAWIISKEKWFNAPWVDELKFKASYGEQGNDNIGDYLYTDTYTIQDSNGSISFVPSTTKGNETISWEKSGNFNTGFEFSFFRGRLAGGIEYFYRKTSDMLAWFTLPPSFGYSGYYDNIGDMTNQGIEIELDGTIIRTKDIEWGINVNFTAYKNEITSMPTENKTYTIDGVEGYSSGNYFYGEGEPIYTFYLPKYAGVDPETGEALYWKDVTDENGNVTGQEKVTDPSTATMHLCGTALPDAYGGFGTRFSYKGFDFSADFTYQIGGQVYDSSYASAMGTSKGYQFHSDILNAWTPENPNTNIPRLQYNDQYTNYTSDRFLTSASYLCLQNVNIGYTLPSNLTSKIGISKLRVYVTGANLWLWSKRQGLDPRQSLSGDTSNAYYSPIRTISGGLTVTF